MNLPISEYESKQARIPFTSDFYYINITGCNYHTTSYVALHKTIKFNPLPWQTTNFKLFQTSKNLQTTISNLTKMAEIYPNGRKTLWEKEKLLVTSNFSFAHSVFKRLVSQGRQKVSLFGNGLTLYHTTPTINDINTRAFENLWEEEKMLVTSIFSFSNNVFYCVKDRNLVSMVVR